METVNISERIRNARLAADYTQQQLADKMNVSYQAVSLWENGTLPATDKLIRLSEELGVSLSSLVEEREESLSVTNKALFDYEHMYTLIKGKAQALKMNDTLKALPFALSAHEGQYRKSNKNMKKDEKQVPYIYHPLSLACILFSMGIEDDEVIASALLHDVVEDCVMSLKDEKIIPLTVAKNSKVQYRELTPEDLYMVNDNVKEVVGLLSHVKEDGADRDKVMSRYYNSIAKNPKAALIKCADRTNNLGSMAWGLSRERMYRQIVETEKYFPKLLKAIKDEPEYYNAAFQFNYQMKTLLDIYKRLL